MNACNDHAFGPVSTCRAFDFTLTFQHVILLISSSVFIAAALLQIGQVADKPAIGGISRTFFRTGARGRECDVTGLTRALLATACFITATVSLAVVSDAEPIQATLVARTALPAIALNFCANFLLIPLTVLCRRKLLHGSDVLALYLFATILTDACRTRTYGHIDKLQQSPVYGLSLASLALKLLLLMAESTPGPKVTGASRESRASFLSRMVFWWLKDVLWTGFRTPLAMVNLDALPSRFETESVGAQLESAWKRQIVRKLRMQAKQKARVEPLRETLISPRQENSSEFEMQDLGQDDPFSDSIGAEASKILQQQRIVDLASSSRSLLPFAIVRAFPSIILAPIIPRLVWTGISLVTPYLVNDTLAYIDSQTGPSAQREPESHGWGLVGAYALSGIVGAFAAGQFYWLVDKGQVLLRGALVENIYRKSLRLHLSAAGKVGDGAVANLMSVDLERVCRAILPAHLFWNGVLQVALSCYLLYRALGFAFFATLVTVLFCMLSPPVLSRGLGDKQTNWSKATDRRVNLTSSAIANAKAVKYSAYENFVIDQLIDGRLSEVQIAWKYYRQLLIVSVLTNLTRELSSFSTYTALLLIDHYTGSQRFNIQTIVTSMTLLSLMEIPLLQMGQNFGSILAALASLRRIQVFLGQPEHVAKSIESSRRMSSTSRDGQSFGSAGRKDSSELRANDAAEPYAVQLENASIGWSRGKPVLVNVSLQIPSQSLTIVCGTIGSGKSTLLQAIMGEVDIFSGKAELPINKAPVAYVAQDSWLQDNVSIRENILLHSAFEPELYRKVLLATAFDIDLKQLPNHDETKAKELSGGQRQRVGLARALYSRAGSYVLDDFTSALDAETAAHVWTALFGVNGILIGSTVIFATNALHLLHNADYVVRLDGGKVVEAGSISEFSRDSFHPASVAESTRKTITEVQVSEAPPVVPSGPRLDGEQTDEEINEGAIRWEVYKSWLKATGAAYFLGTFIFGNCLTSGAQISWQVYLQYFARAQSIEHAEGHAFKWLAGFLALCTLPMITLPLVLLTEFWATLTRAGPRLHEREVRGIWRSSVAFFEKRAPGMILNRFSQDLFILDFELPLAAANFFASCTTVFGSILLLVIPVPPLLGVVAVVSLAFVLVRKLYVPASRQLRRLEMATKSPLYSQITETSKPAGLVTIRGLQRQRSFFETNTVRLNGSQRPYYMLQAVRRWLLTALTLMAMIVNVALVAIVILMKQSKSIGVLGAGLVTATTLSLDFTQLIVSSTELEIASVAVERINAFAQLPAEESKTREGVLRQELARENVKGHITMRNLNVAYENGLKPSLQGINLTIKPGERLGICGRSGSGKSTLLLALFRMLEACEGEILLDDQSISNYTVVSLRDSLTVVPQNALILSTSVRQNLDPAREHDDAAIWNALDTCRLLDIVRAMPEGLDTILDADVILSAGQKQLFSLARAILRKRKVLVLDEATSSMDYETDSAVQRVLRTQFTDCTTLTVAHRIATVRDYDRILVLSSGSIVELDTPDNLLKQPNSIFRALAQEQGVM